MGPIGCPETSVRNYLYRLRYNAEELIFTLLLDGSLKSCDHFLAYITERNSLP